MDVQSGDVGDDGGWNCRVVVIDQSGVTWLRLVEGEDVEATEGRIGTGRREYVR